MLPPGFDAAGLVAALPAGGVAACDALTRACDLSVLPAEAEPYAFSHHAAAVALASASAVTALRSVLAKAEAEAHHKLVKAAVNALRAVRPGVASPAQRFRASLTQASRRC